MFNENLSRRENEVMGAIFTLSEGKERFLVSPYEILSLLPKKAKCDEEKLERTMRSLELDGYFELVDCERKGEKTYVVHMREEGLAYRRLDARRRRGLIFRLLVAAACGLLSAALGILLKLLIGSH